MTPTAPNRHSKVEGNAWEEIFTRMARHAGYALIRIPDGCRRIPGPGGRPRLLAVKTPFDFVLAKGLGEGAAWVGFFDTKTTSKPSFGFHDITEHQLLSLLDMEANNCTAGYVVYFRGKNRIVFYSAGTLNQVRPGKPLQPDDGQDLGTIFDMKLDRLRNTKGEANGNLRKEESREEKIHQENWVQENGQEEIPD